jgi:hypothetical protein
MGIDGAVVSSRDAAWTAAYSVQGCSGPSARCRRSRSRVAADKSPHFVAISSEKLNMKARRREDFSEILLPIFPSSCEFPEKFEGILQVWRRRAARSPS